MVRLATIIALALLASAAHCETSCPDKGDAPVQVTSVEARLELRLADGRRLRLVGLDPAGPTPSDPDLGETGRTAFAATIVGKAVTARVLSDEPDRWGRLPAMAFLDGDPSAGGLSGLALAKGLARYGPEPAAHACREAFRAAENEARSGRLGLWKDPYYGVLAVDDARDFNERSATTVVAEGRLWRVDSGPFRTKLRFAAPGERKRDLLVAVVLPKVVKRFEEQGVHFQALIGRTMRLRGLLDLRFGPQVEIAGPDALEVLAPTAMSASSDTGRTTGALQP